ncbi:MAG TPA: argininosuccinate lyase, partial [Candidatus Binatus sp.]|nr:argininosuccinate lyase [Candidatus Binatus sp.]
MKAWGGRFEAEPDPLVADFGRSIEVDAELALDDLEGSAAHVGALERAGVISALEAATLREGIDRLRADVVGGSVEWDPALEDVHLNLEFALAERIGPLAGKLHTGRSRNDQVSTDLRLWLRRRISDLDLRVVGLERALVDLARRHPDAVMPAHTHVQPAQPVLFAHHLLAHVEMLERDRGRLADAGRRANLSPLGSGAVAGAGFPLDRETAAAALGFDGVTRNSIDASGDRDFVAETLAAVALAMVHGSRLAEELVWWSNPRFGFVRLADRHSTGSSMLPNKRNPDPAELVRGRAAVVIGRLAGFLALLKGLPLGYQRDLQEDKAALFESCRTLDSSLAVLAEVVGGLTVDEIRMREAATEGHGSAVAMADGLVDRGVAFRVAHHIVGGLVRVAEERGVALGGLADDDLAAALAASDDPAARQRARDRGAIADLRAAA